MTGPGEEIPSNAKPKGESELSPHENVSAREEDSSSPAIREADQKAKEGLCPFCREPVSSQARKCIKCGSDIKGWRRYISVGTPTLALLTSLVAVSGAFTPVFVKLFGPHDAVMHVTYISIVHDEGNSGDGFDSVELLVSNDGTKSGAVLDGQVHIVWTISGRSSGVSLFFSKHWHEPTILSPGSSATLVMDIAPQPIPDENTNAADSKAFMNDLSENPVPLPGDSSEFELDSDSDDVEKCMVILNIVNGSGVQVSLNPVPANCGDFNTNLISSQ